MLGGTFFSAISQILLKQSANIKYDNPLREYLNWRVILAYVMFFGILLLNTWCYTKVDMRYGPVIDTAAYVFVLLLSRFILNEKITKGKLIGNLIYQLAQARAKDNPHSRLQRRSRFDKCHCFLKLFKHAFHSCFSRSYSVLRRFSC